MCGVHTPSNRRLSPMNGFNIYQAELLVQPSVTPAGSIKFLLNDRALAFFSASQQHRDTKFPGLSYEDDYKGNAMAGIIQNGRAEIRFHQVFTDTRVKTIWTQAEKAMPMLPIIVQSVTYQGRTIK